MIRGTFSDVFPPSAWEALEAGAQHQLAINHWTPAAAGTIIRSMADVTLSERLIDLLEPFRYALHGDIEDDLVAYEKVVPVGVVAWNLSLLPAEQRDRIRTNIVDGFAPDERETMTRFLDEAIALKHELFPDDRRFIREARVSNHDGALHLHVTSATREED